MNIKQIVASALLIAAAGVNAEQQNAPMAMEAETRGGGKILSLDFESAGDVAAMTFRVVLPDDAKRIDTTQCLSELPKGFTGVCKAYDKVVAVTVYSTDGSVFGAGLNSVGKLSFVSLSKASASIDTFEASTKTGDAASVGNAKVEKVN